ncbi:MAG: hypothetical protein PF487_14620 [Bacteroidales bacterium]|jgi:hypothetical protein|nr:hypothetical protein [Bacteroidales bacterium]
MKLKSYPVGQGNHNNIHYILRSPYFIFKLCGFPDIGKAFTMSASIKVSDILIFDTEYILSQMKTELLNKWDLELIADAQTLFNTRFENTKELLESDYYNKSL